jgi:hypothetical protein
MDYMGLGRPNIIVGCLVHTENLPELLCYFCVQEHQQGIIDGKNQGLQAKAWAKLEHGHVLLSWWVALHAKFEDHVKAKQAGHKHQQGSPVSTKQKTSVSTEDPCPIHVMAGHTWSECFLNACNKDIKKNMTTTTRFMKQMLQTLHLVMTVS